VSSGVSDENIERKTERGYNRGKTCGRCRLRRAA